MSDDSFIREVNEEFRSDQMKALWHRYGVAVVAVALLVVLGTAGYVGYRYWDEGRANVSGDAFSSALKLAQEGKSDEALAALDQLEKDGYGAYPVLARMRAATVKADKGDVDAAVKDFDGVAADGSVPGSLRDMARLRAALLLVDHGSFADVSSRVEALTADTNPLRHTAREALGLAAWKEGKAQDALKLFDQIAADDGAPRNTRQRATLMAELIRGSGTAPAGGAS
ncbi:tetratricopeptide repeat protein [Mesorhizobium sp. 8]|uniref:tetratricopeptide repeat protein n=1 Tax=Mesorhizobium sp. 8 TaxID=2584466 RepID=UPI00112375CB|nr:tetratricopeptide repeat protein [Mesorhizobium sp. 8]QDC01996.1 tetratricopeptide repeat protein [Mesorhizobium sp. 8]